MRIGIIGVGYVGLVTGACLSDFGHRVVCFDKDIDKIELLKKGEIPIFEPGLDRLIKRNVNAKRLSFKKANKEDIQKFDVIFLAV